MEYQLSIEGYENNPDFKPNDREMQGYDYRKPNEREYEFRRQALSVRVTEAQFNAIRKAVLEAF